MENVCAAKQVLTLLQLTTLGLLRCRQTAHKWAALSFASPQRSRLKIKNTYT
jgi:hypothetical protein